MFTIIYNCTPYYIYGRRLVPPCCWSLVVWTIEDARRLVPPRCWSLVVWTIEDARRRLVHPRCWSVVSLVVWTIEDARRLVPPCCWSVAYMQPPAQAGTPRGSTVRRTVSFLNQNFEVELTDVIALIINYLGVPFGMGFTK